MVPLLAPPDTVPSILAAKEVILSHMITFLNDKVLLNYQLCLYVIRMVATCIVLLLGMA